MKKNRINYLIISLLILGGFNWGDKNLKNVKENELSENNNSETLFFDYKKRNGEIEKENNDDSLASDETKENIIALNSLNAIDLNDGFVANKDYLIQYYKNLNENKPRNILGICGYTAVAMLFSFYDSYWSDNFILEKWDSSPTVISSRSDIYIDDDYESPGIKNTIPSDALTLDEIINEILDSGIKKDSNKYKETLDKAIMTRVYTQIRQDTFLGRLFQIALDNGYINPHYDNDNFYYSSNSNDYVSSLGVSYNLINTLINQYIKQNSYLNSNVRVITSKSSNQKKLRNEIIQLVKSGRPVLVGGQAEKDSGHDVIVYDYDETKDVLYANMGWGRDDSHKNIDEYFLYKISDYWALSINSSFEKERSNNYILTSRKCSFSPGNNDYFNQLLPNDFNLPSSYNNSETVYSFTKNYSNFEIKSKNCGYFNNYNLNLSIKTYMPKTAYIKIENSSKTIRKIQVTLSLNSPNESISKDNAYYGIEYLNANNLFSSSLNILNQSNLSTNIYSPSVFTLYLSENINTIRIYGFGTDYTFEGDRGRLSIMDIVLFY